MSFVSCGKEQSRKRERERERHALNQVSIFVPPMLSCHSTAPMNRPVCRGQTPQPFIKQAIVLRVCCSSLLKTQWEKEKLLITSNFSFFHGVFYMFDELSAIFIEFELVCKLFQFGRV